MPNTPSSAPVPSVEVSYTGDGFMAINQVLTPEEKNQFLGLVRKISANGGAEESQQFVNLVSRLCGELQIDWTAGDTPAEQDDKAYWLVIENKHSGHRFVVLENFYQGPGWDHIYFTDDTRFRILAYAKADLPTVPKIR